MGSHNPPLFEAECPRSHSSNRYGISQSTRFRGPTSSLAHHLVSSDTICNSPSLLLLDIVHFGLPLQRGRGFHPLIKNVSLPSPTNVRSHNPPLQNPTSSLTHHSTSYSNTICNNSTPPLDIFPLELPLTTMERLPHPYKECIVLLPNPQPTWDLITYVYPIFIVQPQKLIKSPTGKPPTTNAIIPRFQHKRTQDNPQTKTTKSAKRIKP